MYLNILPQPAQYILPQISIAKPEGEILTIPSPEPNTVLQCKESNVGENLAINCPLLGIL